MKLTQVAQLMKDEAKQRGHSHRTLQRGLFLSLYEREHDVVLSISRPTALVAPSEREIEIVRESFWGDKLLKEINGKTLIWSERKCFIAIEKERRIENGNQSLL